MEENLEIVVGDKQLHGILTKPNQFSSWSKYAVIITHGAGGDINNTHLIRITEKLVYYGFIVLRFTCKPPNFQFRVKCYRAVLEYCKENVDVTGCILAGRSMGGRVAAEVASSCLNLASFIYGVACISYPLHRLKQFADLRTSHLLHLSVPTFIINGTKDSMCKKELMDQLIQKMSCSVTMHWVKEADHSLKLKGKYSEEIVENMCDWFATWCQLVFAVEKS
ncbi:testis-expressed protein 30-like isoform X1 [Hydractinia symbiolongicarpus]|uniref:testis-expressed protein 30-like isoform X1 n=1 Tax=Hydractinia symbiolongicarpus TaxID=13093 RepID=UPI00254B2A52|nr:testis-expressed protein 30-like isoform X1 [Hydractinia symbiolongicarpus]